MALRFAKGTWDLEISFLKEGPGELDSSKRCNLQIKWFVFYYSAWIELMELEEISR